jgi:hypothetical protein
MTIGQGPGLDDLIASWREWMARRDVLSPADIDELESHLRDRIDGLADAGLTEDEAFLIAVKRLSASIDALSHEYAAEHSERLWKQLVLHDAPGIRRHGCLERHDPVRPTCERASPSHSRSASARVWP